MINGRFEFGNVVFHANPKKTSFQNAFVLTENGVKGWDGSVNVRREKVERLYGHGAYQTQATYADRTITLEGVIFADNARQLTFLIDQLAGLPRSFERLYSHTNQRSLWVDASVQSVTVERLYSHLDRAEFQVVLWCPDPFKYGETHRFSARLGQRVELYHRGNTDAYVRLRFNAPSTSEQVVVSGAGRTLRMLQRLQSGSFEHDTRTGKGGTPEQNSWVFGQPLIVPAGAAHSFTVNGTGAGSVDFEVIDTYI